MSEIKVNSIKGVSASTAAISIDNSSGSASANLTAVNSVVMPNGGFLSNKNLIINGAMQCAQYGASDSTTNGNGTVDRFQLIRSGVDENPTQSHADIASGTTPYTLGFRRAFKVTNGNQTSVGTLDYITMRYKIEAQDIANSGWNYLSSSSYITFSYWVKSSVAQNFYNTFKNDDGTSQRYVTETGSLSADTWTKITKTIPGNSNLTFNNDNGEGLEITWELFRGTDQTGTRPLNAWAAADNATRTPDQTSTWYTTDDATFEITGVQLEVGSVATDFEFRSFAKEFSLCQRYYQQYVNPPCTGVVPDNSSKAYAIGLVFQTRMRTTPTTTITNVGSGGNVHDGNSGADIASLNAADGNVNGMSIYLNLDSDLGNFRPATLGRNDSTSDTTEYKFTAEF